ncbi:hypothetical protein COU54_01440 [Candidatus Pacearchaeota archaeon CG10_big_fil_rev_8_21_14_0_10_31_24]|nr:MAG: hypothetical protein COU54_01440 [Candidatus Pacearchaeota archaeon CG10_big_fil_rev_8_21_14_0_10_31_24]
MVDPTKKNASLIIENLYNTNYSENLAEHINNLLHKSVHYNNLELCKTLIKLGADVRYQKDVALKLAMKRTKITFVKCFLDTNAYPKKRIKGMCSKNHELQELYRNYNPALLTKPCR